MHNNNFYSNFYYNFYTNAFYFIIVSLKIISSHFANFEQVKIFSSHFATLNNNYRFMNIASYLFFILYQEKSKTFLEKLFV